MSIYQYSGSAQETLSFSSFNLPSELTNLTWYHFAFVRDSGDWSLYIGEAGDSTGTHRETVTGTARQWGGGGDDIHIGQLWDGSGAASDYYLSGELDEFSITKAVKYTGTGTYTLPTAPFSAIGFTKIYAMNSAGVESPLT